MKLPRRSPQPQPLARRYLHLTAESPPPVPNAIGPDMPSAIRQDNDGTGPLISSATDQQLLKDPTTSTRAPDLCAAWRGPDRLPDRAHRRAIRSDLPAAK